LIACGCSSKPPAALTSAICVVYVAEVAPFSRLLNARRYSLPFHASAGDDGVAFAVKMNAGVSSRKRPSLPMRRRAMRSC